VGLYVPLLEFNRVCNLQPKDDTAHAKRNRTVMRLR
jgi:hypothetical protein